MNKVFYQSFALTAIIIVFISLLIKFDESYLSAYLVIPALLFLIGLVNIAFQYNHIGKVILLSSAFIFLFGLFICSPLLGPGGGGKPIKIF